MPDLPEISKTYWTEIQNALKAHGFDPGEIDGVPGPTTDGALLRFKASRGLRGRPYIGPITLAKLAEEPIETVAMDAPSWLRRAATYLGLKEIPGATHNSTIVAWWELIGAGWFDDDETPWCGAFVAGTLAEEGVPILPGAEAPRARAWEGYGQNLNGPVVGAIVTFWRNSPSSGSGHVAFVVGRTSNGRLACLGGNQNDRVSIANFDLGRVTSYRWPTGKPLPAQHPFDDLPIVDGGHLSISEA
jgi:uncharacterized protein (TIGR02594 family)